MYCASNLRQIALAMKQYAEDNDGRFPPDFGAFYPGYVDHPKIFSCPAKPSRWEEIQRIGRIRPEHTSYVYVSGLNGADPAGCILAYCRLGSHEMEGTNAVFLDTHAEWLRPDEFRRRLKETLRLAREKGREVRLVGE